MFKLLSVGSLIVLFSTAVLALEYEEHDAMLMDHGDGHLMDMAGGMVMGQNTDTLPGGCDSVSETKEITVHAGHKDQIESGGGVGRSGSVVLISQVNNCIRA